MTLPGQVLLLQVKKGCSLSSSQTQARERFPNASTKPGNRNYLVAISSTRRVLVWSRQCLNGSAVTQYVTMALAYHYSAFLPKASLQFLLKSSGFLPSFGGEFCYVVQVLL